MSMRVTVMVGVLAVVLGGCSSKQLTKTGFLSDYSKLEVESKTEMVYVNKEGMTKYHKFIIAPIQTHFYNSVDISDDDLAQLRQYLYKVVYTAIEAHDKVVHQSGPGVAKVRIALTNLKETNVALNILPQTKLSGLGLGGASVEAELVDSVTGEQIAAVVKSQGGNQFSFDGYSKWSDAKSIMDKWGQKLQERLVEAD